MLDWLKEIIGDTYTEEIDKAASTKIGELFVSRTDFNALNDTKKGLEESIGVKDQQIADRDSELEKLKEIDPENLQKELTTAQETIKQKDIEKADAIAEVKQNYAAEAYIGTFEFTSKSARKTILNDFKEADLKFENGEFLGADDFMKKKKEEDPESFVDEKDDKKPYFAGGADKGGKLPTEKMTISEAMAYANEHPEVNIDDLNIE